VAIGSARGWLATLGPGLLVAATGVGAGDLLTASFAGSSAGLTILWAALAGALLKWTLNEGIARWQLATGTSLLDGWSAHLPLAARAIFGLYFLLWTVMVGGALVNACGVAATAILPLGPPAVSKILWGIVHSVAGYGLARLGGFRLFERAMSTSVAVLFAGVVVTAVLIDPDWSAVARGALVPRMSTEDLPWLLGLLGGVGGTVTLLSYGYWIRAAEREGASGLRACRLDLTAAYVMTAVFGMAMVTIGSRIQVEGSGIAIAPTLAAQIGDALGPVGQWTFLAGFWSAVFSSLLGVWQSAPYLFADFVVGRRTITPGDDLAETRPYRTYLLFTALAPLPLLWITVARVQLFYAVLGALFMPFLALTLLVMNNRVAWVGARFTNGRVVNALLIVTVVLFAVMGVLRFTGLTP